MSVSSPPRSKVRPKADSAAGARAGRFGVYGGRYVPETLMAALEELERPTRRRRPTPHFRPNWTTCCTTTAAGLLRSTWPSG